MSNQLGLPEVEQVAIGHWKKGSAMPQQYDAITNSLETRAKQRVLNALKKGFVMGKPGEFLMDIPEEKAETLNVVCEEEVAAPFTMKSDQKGERLLSFDSLSPSKEKPHSLRDIEEGVLVQVQNSFSRKIHLHLEGSSGTICGRWECGSRKCPTLKANFFLDMESIPFRENVKDLCGGCYSEAKAKVYKDIAKIPTVTALVLNEDSESSYDSDASEKSENREEESSIDWSEI